MDVTISINTDNAAFADHPAGAGGELAQILHRCGIWAQVNGPHLTPTRDIPLLDSNGNVVGKLVVTA